MLTKFSLFITPDHLFQLFLNQYPQEFSPLLLMFSLEQCCIFFTFPYGIVKINFALNINFALATEWLEYDQDCLE